MTNYNVKKKLKQVMVKIKKKVKCFGNQDLEVKVMGLVEEVVVLIVYRNQLKAEKVLMV